MWYIYRYNYLNVVVCMLKFILKVLAVGLLAVMLGCGGSRNLGTSDEGGRAQSPDASYGDRLFHLDKKADLIARIQREYREAIFIRKISNPHLELKNIVEPLIDVRERLKKDDDLDRYWNSASVVREGLAIPIYDSAATTGLVISNRAQVGFFLPTDAGMPVAQKKTADLRGLPIDSSQVRYRFATDQLYNDYGHPLFDMASIKDLLQKMASGIAPLAKHSLTDSVLSAQDPIYRGQGDPTYNEALVHYRIQDILGIWMDKDSPSAARDFHKEILDAYQADLPLVIYQFKKIDAAILLYDENNFSLEFDVQ